MLLPVCLIGSSSAATVAKSLQSCPTLCDPIDGSPPGSTVPGILQARTLEWFAISFSNAGKWKVKGKSLSRVWLFSIPWTAAHQASPSMGFSRQECWSGVPLPSPNWEQYLQLIGFMERVHNRRLFQSHYIHFIQLWPMVWLAVVHFTCPTISSIPHYCTLSIFHHPLQFILKMKCFCYV